MSAVERTDLATVNLVKGTSADMTMLAEVGGSIVRVKAEDIVPYREEDVSYGVTFDFEEFLTVGTRIGNMALHKTLPVQSLMRGCLLNDNGEVVKYLNAKDWTDDDRSGESGQVMVEIPLHWRKCSTDGTKLSVSLSLYPVPGYQRVPKCYVSAYQAAMDRTTGKLASVVNMDARYRGGDNTSSYDGTYRTLCGRPASSLSRTAFRNAARKRKANSIEWNCYLNDIHKTIYWLFVVEYATLNSQKAINATPTAEGFRQGGLGEGVTNLTYDQWNKYNDVRPFVPCGYTDSLGNGTGEIALTLDNGSADTPVKVTTKVNRYRGIECPFGHIWHWIDGINVRISPNADKGGDGLSKVFVCSDPAKFNDSNYEGYSYIGNEARTNGYVKEVIFGEGGEIMPQTVGGGSTTYFCDNHYTNIPTTETLRGVLFGGSANSGSSAGFVYANSNCAPSDSSTYVGSRLCFIPAIA